LSDAPRERKFEGEKAWNCRESSEVAGEKKARVRGVADDGGEGNNSVR
jgi:hypothetical protein